MTSEQEIESAIAQTREWIRPSDQLRADTIQSARQVAGDQRARQRFSWYAVALGAALLLASPLVYYASRGSIPVFRWSIPAQPTSDQVQRAAAERASDRPGPFRAGMDPSWSIVDQFDDIRQTQRDHSRRLSDRRFVGN